MAKCNNNIAYIAHSTPKLGDTAHKDSRRLKEVARFSVQRQGRGRLDSYQWKGIYIYVEMPTCCWDLLMSLQVYHRNNYTELEKTMKPMAVN